MWVYCVYMSMTSDGPERGEPDFNAISGQINGLGQDVFTGTEDADFNAFVSMYNMLPEHKMTATLGTDIAFEFDAGEDEPQISLRPTAVYGDAVVARDRRMPRSGQDVPKFVFLKGCVYLDEMQVETFGDEAICEQVTPIVSRGVSRAQKLETGLKIVYSATTFCRDARLAYMNAYPMEALRQQSIRKRTLKNPINGAVITVMLGPDRPLTLLVEESAQLTPPIRKMTQRIGGDHISMLSYT